MPEYAGPANVFNSYPDLYSLWSDIAEIAVAIEASRAPGYKVAGRHHGATGLRDPRKDDVADELRAAE
jgi:hypothetical protein